MKPKRLAIALATVGALGIALPAAAQFAKPEDAVKYRQAAFTLMGAHFGRIGAMVQGKVPFDATAAAANADLVVTMSKLPYAGFVEGTSRTDKGGPKASIWTERAKFDEKAKAMQAAVVKLDAAAKTGKEDALKSAFGDAAKACKSCHDDYRNQ